MPEMLAHSVFFTLKDGSAANRERLIEATRKYLSTHPGTVFFACGARDAELDRPVNDRGFDVALHVIFESRAAHDAYQPSELHKRFIAENQDSWAEVRVFDALVTGTSP